MAEQEEGSQADLPPAVQENFERARTNLKNKGDDLSSKTRGSAQDASDAISRTTKTVKSEAEKKAKSAGEAFTGQLENAKGVASDAKDAIEQAAKDAQEAVIKGSKNVQEAWEKNSRGGQEVHEKKTDEATEANEKRKQDDLAEDEHEEVSTVESAEQGDKPTDGEEIKETDDTVKREQDAADPEPPNADQAPRPETSEPEHPAESKKPNAKTDSEAGPPKADREAEKADEEWDPEDGRDAEAEAYEGEINAMLNASEKRAEQELLPDNIS